MINSIYALGSYEINLQTKEEQSYIFDQMQQVCDYIDTAINYNNDYLLPNNGYKLISKISACHYDDYEFFVDNHLKCLRRKYIDIMLIHSERGDWKPLALKMNADTRFKHTGVSNFAIQDLEEYKKLIGKYPEYNEIEINPYYGDIDTINFCKQHDIKIIAYGILGGKYNAVKNVATFSLPYLLLLAQKYADMIIIRPDSFRQVNEFIDVVKNYQNDYINQIKFVNNNDKSIRPMVYDTPVVKKTCIGFPTYNNACGHNISDEYTLEELHLVLPAFEMLGDYMTYIRYKYKTKYNDSVYYYDLLIGDDAMYAVYVYDYVNITKVNKNNDVKIYRINKR